MYRNEEWSFVLIISLILRELDKSVQIERGIFNIVPEINMVEITLLKRTLWILDFTLKGKDYIYIVGKKLKL